MVSSRRSYDRPHFPLYRVHMAVALRRVVITTKAYDEARRVLPDGLIDVTGEIVRTVGNLEEGQFQFASERSGRWVDVYRVRREEVLLWIKVKLETDPASGEELIVISFHEWDDSIPI